MHPHVYVCVCIKKTKRDGSLLCLLGLPHGCSGTPTASQFGSTGCLRLGPLLGGVSRGVSRATTRLNRIHEITAESLSNPVIGCLIVAQQLRLVIRLVIDVHLLTSVSIA